jgi:hypothetical protein
MKLDRGDIDRLPPGRHTEKATPGLVLTVRLRARSITAAFWSFRYRGSDGKWHEIGLGSRWTTKQDSARKKAQALRKQIAKGLAPVVPVQEPFWPPSSRAMAKHFGRSAETMNRPMRKLEADQKVQRRIRVTGRDGKTYPRLRSSR